MVLSIAIPTYNRPTQLCKRLSELLPQIKERHDIEVIVIDNASISPSQEVVADYLNGSIPSNIKVVTNIANIGMAANICRCFEHSSGKWTWILGDDDEVRPDAIQIILESLEKDAPEKNAVDVFCFSSGIYSYNSSFSVASPKELWESLSEPSQFSNFLFISNKVVRTAGFLRHAGIGYQFCYSAAPHLAVFMTLLNSGRLIRFESGYIIDWEQPSAAESWNGYLVAAGMPSLVEVLGNEAAVYEHLAAGLDFTLWKPFLRGGLHLILFDQSRPPQYWYYQLRKFSVFLKGRRLFYAYILLFLCKGVIALPSLKNLLGRMVIRFKTDMRSPTSGMDRN